MCVPGVGHDLLTDGDAAGHDLQDAGGQAGVAQELGDHQAADDRRLGGGLQHDGVAERERRGDHAHAEHEREVPGREAADDADRHALRDAEAAGAVRGKDLGGRTGGESGGLEQLVRRGTDLVLGFAADRTGLADDLLDEFGGALLEREGCVAQHAGADVVALRGPGGLCAAGCLDGAVDVLLRRRCRHCPSGVWRALSSTVSVPAEESRKSPSTKIFPSHGRGSALTVISPPHPLPRPGNAAFPYGVANVFRSLRRGPDESQAAGPCRQSQSMVNLFRTWPHCTRSAATRACRSPPRRGF